MIWSLTELFTASCSLSFGCFLIVVVFLNSNISVLHIKEQELEEHFNEKQAGVARLVRACGC